MSRSVVVRLVLVFVGILGLASVGHAQTGLTGAVDGTVSDEAGKPIGGVKITLTGSKLMGASVTESEPNGEYHFSALNPGPDFALKFEAQGYEPVQAKGLPVSIRATTAVNIHMKRSVSREVLEAARAANLTDASNARGATSVGSDLAAETLRSDAFGVVAVAVGVVRESASVGGATAELTQSTSYNGSTGSRYNVNGGETTAGAGNGRYGNFSSYVETVVEVAGASADVRRGAPGGFQGELVTKIGSNAFHGNFNSAFYNKSFVGDNTTQKMLDSGLIPGQIDGTKVLRDIDEQVGGPLLKDKVWFFIAGRHYHVERLVAGQPTPTRGDLNPGLNIAVDFKTNQSNRFQMYWGYDPKQDWTRAMDRTHPFEASGNQQAWSRTIQGKGWHTLGQRTVVEEQFFYYTYWWPTYPQPGSGAPASNNTTGFFFGGENETNIQRHPERWEGSGSITRNFSNLWGASHEIKVGTDIGKARVLDITSFGNGGAFCVLPGNCTDPDAVYRYKTTNGVVGPLDVKLDNGPIGPDRYNNLLTIYATDRLTAGRWTVNYGGRFDYFKNTLPAQCQNENARWVLQGVFAAECFPAKDTLTWKNVLPRLSATYKITDDGRTLVKASYGIYSQEMIPETQDPVNANSTLTKTYGWRGDLNGNGRLDFPSEVTSTTPTSTKAFKGSTFAADYHASTARELGIGFEKQILQNFTFSTNFFYAQYLDNVNTTNTGIPVSAYLPVTGYPDPGGFAAGLQTSPTVAAHTLTVYNIDKAFVANSISTIDNFPGVSLKSYSWDVRMQKRLSDGWQVLATYNFNHTPYTRVVDQNDLNLQINQNGDSPQQVKHAVKVNGSYTFNKADVTVGLNYGWRIGSGFDRTLNVQTQPGFTFNQSSLAIVADTPGLWKYDNQSQIDVKLTKNFRLGPGRRLGISFDGYNLANVAQVGALGGAGIISLTGPTFGQIVHTTLPRTFRIGGRFSF